MLKLIHKKDFEDFEINKCGRVICPTGDYRKFTEFVEACSFESHSSFANGTKFANNTHFGPNCLIGHHSYIGNKSLLQNVKIGNNCTIGDCIHQCGGSCGDNCLYGAYGQYSNSPSFGNFTKIGKDSIFNCVPNFAPTTHFGKGTTVEGKLLRMGFQYNIESVYFPISILPTYDKTIICADNRSFTYKEFKKYIRMNYGYFSPMNSILKHIKEIIKFAKYTTQ